MSAIRTPCWTSHRRMLEQKLSDLHKCSDPNRLKQCLAQIYKANLHQDPFIAPKLISSFSICHLITHAVSVFDQVRDPNTLLYNTLIRALAQNSLPNQAFCTFFKMQRSGVGPDNFTFPFLLKACLGPSALFTIRMIHNQIVKFGFSSDIFVPNSLIDSYSKCGAGLDDVRKLFDEMSVRDVVSWNSLISGLVKAGELDEARDVFEKMPERDVVSWNTVLDGYAKAGEMDAAFRIFERMPERNIVSWSTMLSGYSKCGDIEMARILFDKMPVKSLVPWTIMISGYAEKGMGKQATCLYDEMEKDGFEPDDATVISILAACGESGLLALGKRIHQYISRTELKYRTKVCNALVDMYVKCGSLEKATKLFDGMTKRDVVSWNSMVQGLAIHGHGKRALELFWEMKQEGIAPDGVTFVGVLCACTHVGLVDEGRQYFSSMQSNYGLVPQVEHFGCMVDLLGRAGCLKEALELIRSMPMKPNAIIWGTLLGACRVHNDTVLADEVVNQLIGLDPTDAGNYAILSNIYASAGQWDGVARVRMQMKGSGVQKSAGSSSIEVDGMVHDFTVRDCTHPQSHSIYRMIDRLGQHLKQTGYLSNAHS